MPQGNVGKFGCEVVQMEKAGLGFLFGGGYTYVHLPVNVRVICWQARGCVSRLKGQGL